MVKFYLDIGPSITYLTVGRFTSRQRRKSIALTALRNISRTRLQDSDDPNPKKKNKTFLNVTENLFTKQTNDYTSSTVNIDFTINWINFSTEWLQQILELSAVMSSGVDTLFGSWYLKFKFKDTGGSEGAIPGKLTSCSTFKGN